MPSKGTQVYTVRLPPDLVAEAQAQIDSRNSWTVDLPWTLSDFIRVSMERNLAKMARSRKPRRRRRLLAAPAAAAGDVVQVEE